MSEARRSSRPHKASASYGEEVDVEHPPLRKRVKTTSSKRYNERKPHQVKVATAEQRDSAMQRAEKLKSSLPSDHPSFIRSMIKSHVYTCYWLSISKPFCASHLPTKDVTIILEDEKGEKHDTNFLANRNGLSGGWRGFAIKHRLHDGDAVIFELTQTGQTTRIFGLLLHNVSPQWLTDIVKEEADLCVQQLQVYIIRAHDDDLEEEEDVMVTDSVQDMEKVALMVTESEKPVELADPIKEKAAPKPRVDGSNKRSRRKLSKPVKSDDGVSSSKIEEEDDDLIDDEILNGAVATNNQRGTSKIKLFRRRSFAKTKLFRTGRTWADEWVDE